jgi:hypothetical protein
LRWSGSSSVVASGAGLFAYRYVTQPTTLTIAAGSHDGEAARVLSAIASRLANTRTDKDAYIAAHPGAAAFYDGTQQGFFDKYSNALYYGPMLLGGLASLLAGIWKFIGVGGNGRIGSPLNPLYALAGRIRAASSEAELAVKEEIDNILKVELARYAKGDLQPGDAAALSLAAHRLEHLINYRRNAFEARNASTSQPSQGA